MPLPQNPMSQGTDDGRNAVTQALLDVQNPPPRLDGAQLQPPQGMQGMGAPQGPPPPPSPQGPPPPPTGGGMPGAMPGGMPPGGGMPMGAPMPGMGGCLRACRECGSMPPPMPSMPLQQPQQQPGQSPTDMGGKPSAPTPPNPTNTLAAANTNNIGSTVANAFLNNTNQYTPEGSLRYDQTGSYSWTDPLTGTTADIPRFSATQQYSPQQQKIMIRSTPANTTWRACPIPSPAGCRTNWRGRWTSIPTPGGRPQFDLRGRQVQDLH